MAQNCIFKVRIICIYTPCRSLIKFFPLLTDHELKDMGFLREKFEEEVNWKTLALNNITLLKDKIKVINIY